MSKYRTFDVVSIGFENGRVLCYSRRTEETILLSQNEAQWLLWCQSFKELSEHATDHVRKTRRQHLESLAENAPISGLFARWALSLLDNTEVEFPVSDGEVSRVAERLRKFPESGLLVSESELRTALRKTSEDAMQGDAAALIESLALSTRNRPSLLKRALTSHVEELKNHGREVEMIVLDDSDSEDARAQNRAILSEAEEGYGLPVRYADRDSRAAYADRLAEVAGTDPAIAHFALVGDPQRATYGAPRNAHLLDTAGRLSLQIDDDIVGGVLSVPQQKSGMTLGSDDGRFHQLWAFEDGEAALQFPDTADTNILAAHEELLGRPAAGVATETMDREEDLILDHVSASLFDDIEHGARVAVSMAGTAGDSAMPNHLDARLLQQGESFRRLVEHGEDAYETRLTTRHLVRSPLRTRILKGRFFMAGISGYDGRQLLPPFMPVGRREDGAFGHILHSLLDSSVVGYTPYVLRHAPSEPRERASISELVNPSKLRLNDLVEIVIEDYDDSRLAPDPAEAIERLGLYVQDVAEQSQPNFNAFIRERVAKQRAGRIRYAERRLEEENETPDYWAQNLRTLIENYEQQLTKDFFFAPVDLEGPPSRRLVMTRHLFEKYGHLIEQWPAIVEAAKELRAGGYRVSEAV